VAETKSVLNCFKLFLAMPIFSALYGQNSSRFVFQATRMDGDVGFYTIKPDQIMTAMTFSSFLLVPLINYVIYPLLSRLGIRSLLHKMICGFVCCVFAFIAAAIVEWRIEMSVDNSLHFIWLLPQLCFISIADVFVWIPATNLAYIQAPSRMKSVMSSFVYLMVAVGSLIITFVSASKLIESQALEFLMYSGLMVVNIVYFMLITKNIKLDENK
jgi:dipeptide/tripeptide permease